MRESSGQVRSSRFKTYPAGGLTFSIDPDDWGIKRRFNSALRRTELDAQRGILFPIQMCVVSAFLIVFSSAPVWGSRNVRREEPSMELKTSSFPGGVIRRKGHGRAHSVDR